MTAGLLDKLPAEDRERLEALSSDSRTMLGAPRPIQAVVERNLATFERLLNGGLGYAEIAALLAELGLVRPDGKPHPISTISSAVSRGRMRAAAGRSGVLRARADGGGEARDPAIFRRSPRSSKPARPPDPTAPPPRTSPPPERPTSPSPLPPSTRRPEGAGPTARRNAALLNWLGDRHD